MMTFMSFFSDFLVLFSAVALSNIPGTGTLEIILILITPR